MEERGTRRRPGSTSVMCNCPICGRQYSFETIGEHADACAVRQEKKANGSAVRSAPASRARSAASRVSKKKRTTVERRPREPRPRVDPVWWIDVDVIDGFTFRSQRWTESRVSARPRKKLTGIPHRTTLSNKVARAIHGDPVDWWTSNFNGEPHKARSSMLYTSGSDADAVQMLKSVRHAFSREPNVVSHLADVLMGFSTGLIDTVQVMEHVSSLFKGHWHLIQQFNGFLPHGYRIEPLKQSLRAYKCCHNNQIPSQPVAEQLAFSFFNRIEERFRLSSPEKLSELYRLLSSAQLDQLLDVPSPSGDEIFKAPPALKPTIDALVDLLEHNSDLAQEMMQYIPSSLNHSGHIHTLLPC
ncbi:hypothetical protein AB1Y20_013561 [Prymnesium parvum]|uniref:Uncharacterized protein n=1 Tax=Prymnesium parvum TaxID=97485 RepID=A0AB34IGM5_PRYPA|mmetsp:Transcript_38424/g.95576  ORF Transcript_38424/g.95576 Transcript_38424/m.95576 type:complete len:357 (-) Transcript_38424:430-1500(-)